MRPIACWRRRKGRVYGAFCAHLDAGVSGGRGQSFGSARGRALPRRLANHYVRSKLEAEGLVQQASAAGLPTVTLRPRGLYGPGDTVVLPRIIRALQSGRLPRIGPPDTIVDMTYIDNAVDAVILALNAGDEALGRTYHITDGTPVPVWPFVDRLCELLSLPKPTRTVSVRTILLAAGALEGLHSTLLRHREPLMTRYTARLLAESLTLDIGAARRELGYQPTVSIEKGLPIFCDWWRRQA
ncbi:MAG: NAD-dependent epimerase/dehydratase family protein [Planctomycetota bacterium]